MNPPSSQGSQADIEARFAHLLNPIRDLAKNWNIDLSSNLEDYLAELGNVELVFDNGKTTMNFAQAALLIQGSACVYSKKVEYLYNLANEILKLFSNRKNRQSEKVANNDASTSQIEGDPADEFLSLDNIEVDNNLEMKVDDSKNKRLSFKYLARTPTVLTPSENAVKGDIMLYNHAGELIGNKNDFHVNMSKIHSSGMLIIDTTIAAETIDFGSCLTELKPSSTKAAENEPAMDAMSDNDVGCCNDDDDFGNCASPAMSACMDNGQMTPPPADARSLETSNPPDLMRRSLRVKQAKEKNSPKHTPPAKDPLKLLDPYEETKWLIKPVKKLRRFLMPESLEKESSAKPKKKSRLEEKLETISEFCSLQFEKKGRVKCKTFKEFENQFWKEMDRRKEIASKKYARKRARDEKKKNYESEAPEESDDEDAHSIGFGDDMPFNDDVAGDDDNNEDDVVSNALDQIDNHLSGDHLFGGKRPKDGNVIVQSYEDLVREHVDKYLSSAGTYAQLTDLSQRVKDWEERIKPKLEAEDKHVSYDIHVYGSRILNTFEESNGKNKNQKTMSFQEICDNQPRYEICRLFLASLQLANNYNVEITTDGPLQPGVDSMKVTILSSSRHHEELQVYRAPSIL